MPEKTKIELCTSLLAEIFESNKELLLELQFYNAVGRYKKDHPILERLIVNDDLSIDSGQMPDSEIAITGINALINAARSIMEIFIGAEEAESRILEPAREFLNANDADIRDLGLLDICPSLAGLAEPTASEETAALAFGIKVIDEALRHDLTNEHALLIRGHCGVERDIVLALFAKSGLDSGGGVIYATSTEPPYEVEKRLEQLGVDTEKCRTEKRLIIIDWFSKNVDRIQGIEVDGNLVRCSSDLTNVSVAFDMALNMLSESTEKRAVIDFLSPSVISFDFETVLDFIGAIQAKLKGKNCFNLVSMNKNMHPRQEVSAIQDIFDGVIDIGLFYEEGAAVRDLGVIEFSGFFDSTRTRINLTERGVWFGDDVASPTREEYLVSKHEGERVDAGMSGLDIMTGGGLFKGSSILLLMPPGTFPLDIINQLSADILKKDFSVSIVISTPSPAEVIARLHETGLVTTALLNSSALRIIDWQTQKNQRVMGVDDSGGILSASKDIMHLGVALDMAINQIDSGKIGFSIIETLAYSLREYDIKTVYHFAQTLRAKFKKRGITSYFIMEKGTQDKSTISALEEIFDGVVDVVNIGGELAIGISSMKNTNYMKVYKPLTKLRSGLTIEVTETVQYERSEIPEDTQTLEDVVAQELEDFKKDRQLLEKERKDIEVNEKKLKDGLDNLKERIEAFNKEKGKKDDHHDELKHILTVLDDMLEGLPEEVIEKFANSDDFKKYEKIMDIYLSDSDDKSERD